MVTSAVNASRNYLRDRLVIAFREGKSQRSVKPPPDLMKQQLWYQTNEANQVFYIRDAILLCRMRWRSGSWRREKLAVLEEINTKMQKSHWSKKRPGWKDGSVGHRSALSTWFHRFASHAHEWGETIFISSSLIINQLRGGGERT